MRTHHRFARSEVTRQTDWPTSSTDSSLESLMIDSIEHATFELPFPEFRREQFHQTDRRSCALTAPPTKPGAPTAQTQTTSTLHTANQLVTPPTGMITTMTRLTTGFGLVLFDRNAPG
jgi:hypothetical protein